MIYFLGLVVVLVAGIGFVRLFGAGRPPYLGLRNGQLAACPDSPNCVCSQATDALHQIAPIPFQGASDAGMSAIEAAVMSLPRTTIVTKSVSEGYLHAEARSHVFGFVDDVEFWFDEANHVIHVRSASRVGYSDLGVNRARVELLTQSLMQQAEGGK